jgi:hypothetical protein
MAEFAERSAYSLRVAQLAIVARLVAGGEQLDDHTPPDEPCFTARYPLISIIDSSCRRREGDPGTQSTGRRGAEMTLTTWSCG